MENIQNNRSNQSYYDLSDAVCSAEHYASSGATDAFVQTQVSATDADPASAGTAHLVAVYSASGSGGAPPSSQAQGTGGEAGIPDEASEESSLCEHRLRANRVICGIGSGLLGNRVELGALGNSGAGYVIGEACVRLADWLEYNAPLGACGQD